MRSYAASIRKTGKYVGMFPFLVWSVKRGLRVELQCGRGRLDPVAEFAPWAAAGVREPPMPLIALWTRVLRVPMGDGDHTVVRGLTTDADVANGNHWMAGLHTPGLDKMCEAFQHQPCDGRLCAGGASKHCLGPIRAPTNPFQAPSM